jgi:hypothetical protein
MRRIVKIAEGIAYVLQESREEDSVEVEAGKGGESVQS